MPYALMTSGGKDSTLALDRAKRGGMEIGYLVNIYEGSTGRVRFHGVRHALIRRQAEAMGIELLTGHTTPDDFEAVFGGMLEALVARDVEGVVFGNVHLADVRAWYEERVRGAGLEHIEPLWGEPAVELAWEVVERGYRALIVSVDLNSAAAKFIGREFDSDLVTELTTIDDLDPCGERGEYHTFVFDGPEFRRAVAFTTGDRVDLDGHRFIDLVPA